MLQKRVHVVLFAPVQLHHSGKCFIDSLKVLHRQPENASSTA
jgi:hypothetical protein